MPKKTPSPREDYEPKGLEPYANVDGIYRQRLMNDPQHVMSNRQLWVSRAMLLGLRDLEMAYQRAYFNRDTAAIKSTKKTLIEAWDNKNAPNHFRLTTEQRDFLFNYLERAPKTFQLNQSLQRAQTGSWVAMVGNAAAESTAKTEADPKESETPLADYLTRDPKLGAAIRAYNAAYNTETNMPMEAAHTLIRSRLKKLGAEEEQLEGLMEKISTSARNSFRARRTHLRDDNGGSHAR